jgi:hypothetical protein
MKKIFCIPALLFILCSMKGKSQENWVLKKDKNGIQVFTRKAADIQFDELKVECTLDGRVSQLAAVVLDINNHTKWVYKSTSCYLVKATSATDLFFYNVTECPWPLDNRDAVVHLTLSQDAKTKIMTIEVKNVDGLLPVKQNLVRVKYSNVVWKVEPLSDRSMHVEYTIRVDPGGSIPAWVVNLFATKGPYETFMRLREMVKSGQYANAKFPFLMD